MNTAIQPISITQGNTPRVTDTLRDDSGVVVDLTGCTLQFVWQGSGVSWTHTATIDDALTGDVSYQFAAGETDVVGDYAAQWRVTKGDTTVVLYPYPSGTITFRVVEALPLASPTNIVYLRQMYEPVRCVLGDFNSQFRKYEDDAIASVLRTCLLTGRVPGQTLSANRWGITPGIAVPTDMALLMNHAAKMFIMPNVAGYRYETRALSERFERQDSFYFELNNAIYELENGAMFSSFQSFYSWVNALTGIDIWSMLSDMQTSAPVATVNIGRAGVTVTTS